MFLLKVGRALLVVAAMVLGACAGDVSAQPAPDDGDSLRVATFNIRFDGVGEDGPWAWPLRRDDVLRVVQSLDADVVALQEVTSWDGMSVVASRQLAFLTEATDEYAVAGGQPVDEIWSSNPVFYRRQRLAVVDTGTLFYTGSPDELPETHWDDMVARFARWVRFRDREDGSEFLLVNTHWSPVRGGQRLRAAALLARRLPGIAAGVPIIVVGDLNVSPGWPSYRRLLRRLELSDAVVGNVDAESPNGTYNRGRVQPRRGRIDHILVSPGVAVRRAAIVTRRPDGRFASDHYPVSADLVLGAGAQSD